MYAYRLKLCSASSYVRFVLLPAGHPRRVRVSIPIIISIPSLYCAIPSTSHFVTLLYLLEGFRSYLSSCFSSKGLRPLKAPPPPLLLLLILLYYYVMIFVLHYFTITISLTTTASHSFSPLLNVASALQDPRGTCAERQSLAQALDWAPDIFNIFPNGFNKGPYMGVSQN